MDFIIGGAAGSFSTIFTNPMDMVKTRLQLQGELKSASEQAPRYRGTLHAMYVIARTDGVLALQNGLLPAMIYGFFMNSVRLGIFRIAEVQGWTKTKEGNLSIVKAMFCSGLGGAAGAFAANPVSVLKIRLQALAHPTIAVGRQHNYKGAWDGCTQIFKKEGICGFFAGASAASVRLGVGSAAQLTTFSAAKQALVFHEICKDSPFRLAFMASSVSGVAVCLFACPFDVVSIRLANQGSGPALYNGMLDCLIKTFRAEGVRGLYKGVVPLYWRIAPHTTITLVIWDVLHHLLFHKSL